MGAALCIVDVVRKRKHAGRDVIHILECNLRAFPTVGLSLYIKDISVHRLEPFVLVLHEREESSFKIKCLRCRFKPKPCLRRQVAEVKDISKV